MRKQKTKSFIQEISWFFLTLMIVVVVSFVLTKINEYYQNKFEVTSVQASTIEVLKNNPISSSDEMKDVVQVTTLLKRGYVGDYFITNPSDQKVELSSVEVKEVPKVLGVKTEKKPYQAELVRKSYPLINIAPGKRITFEAEFKNTGTETWYNNSEHFIALNVTNPPGRKSLFRDFFWPKDYRPAVMKTEIVRPGETGLFRFALTAPSDENWHTEKFGLVAEHLTWIEGGNLEVAMKTGNPKSHFLAEKVDQAYQEITIEPGKAITFWVDFKNSGSQTWYQDGEHFIALNVTDPTGRESPFQHGFWVEYYRPTKMKNDLVSPGEIARFAFALQAPESPGNYVEKFGLVAEYLTWIEGGDLEIPIKVEAEPEPITEIEGEPDIRIGLFPTSSKIKVTGNGNYEIRDANDKLFGTYAKNVVSTIDYDEGEYTLSVQGKTSASHLSLRAIPKKKQTILEITNFENRPEWNEEINDNRFRGILEIHYAEETKQLWVINELPLESYLRGVAEAGNENDEDYLKSLMIAARTYGMYHIQTNTKHDEENFTVDAIFDQVYRGYEFELRSPKITQAILDTEGIMVTYEDEVAVTPYFSQTDGRTRSWEEVWSGGPYPWLVSVPDPACKNLGLLGHGVGMSAYGARAMAEDGATYEEILKYYYSGVEVEEIY